MVHDDVMLCAHVDPIQLTCSLAYLTRSSLAAARFDVFDALGVRSCWSGSCVNLAVTAVRYVLCSPSGRLSACGAVCIPPSCCFFWEGAFLAFLYKAGSGDAVTHIYPRGAYKGLSVYVTSGLCWSPWYRI